MSKPWKQNGDTIVEVMISMAVIAVVLVAAYITTDHSLNSSEAATEREDATMLAQSQFEIMSNASSTELGSAPAKFCFPTATSLPIDITSGSCNKLGNNNLYDVTITKQTNVVVAPDLPTYQLEIDWASILGGNATTFLYYQPYLTH
jgi:prepilin-type N-terminal cleavage/methylation domain-containing protein